MTPLVDLHCHLVPGVDDGARSADEAIARLEEFRDLEITRVVATPHLRASRSRGEWRAKIVQEFQALATRAATVCPEIELTLSYEICLDDPDADLRDRRLGLGFGGRLLVEFAMLVLPPFADAVLDVARHQGWVPVLAHPERYLGVARAYDRVERWRSAGTVMCVNAGSLWGEYGREAQRVARFMLSCGHVDVLASDHHARPRRSTTVRRAWDFLTEAGLEEQARLLLIDNPLAVLRGDPTEPVPPAELPRGWRERLRRLVLGA